MTTMQALVDETRRTAYGTLTESTNLVAAGGYTAGSTTLNLQLQTNGILPGAIVSSGLNVWIVTNVISPTQLQVAPGYDGSPGGNLDAGAWVYIRPRVTDWQIFDMLNREIVRLSSPDIGLYRLDHWNTIPNIVNSNYPIPDGVYPEKILRMRYLVLGWNDVWYDYPPRSWSYDPVNRLIQSWQYQPASPSVQFWYSGGFEQATSLDSDPVVDCGLAESMTDIPVLGAIWKLMLTTESRRNQVQTQGDSRKANEVPSSANSQTSQYYRRLYQSRCDEEYGRLIRQVSIDSGW